MNRYAVYWKKQFVHVVAKDVTEAKEKAAKKFYHFSRRSKVDVLLLATDVPEGADADQETP